MLRFSVVFVVLLTSLSSAQTRLTVSCDEPKGSRFDYSAGVFKQSEDGFKGLNPVFILDKKTPGKLTFIWGATRLIPKDIAPDEAQDATILSSTENKITAVYVDETNAVLLFSLFPKEGIVYFTQHRHLSLSGPNTSTFYCKATFKYSHND